MSAFSGTVMPHWPPITADYATSRNPGMLIALPKRIPFSAAYAHSDLGAAEAGRILSDAQPAVAAAPTRKLRRVKCMEGLVIVGILRRDILPPESCVIPGDLSRDEPGFHQIAAPKPRRLREKPIHPLEIN